LTFRRYLTARSHLINGIFFTPFPLVIVGGSVNGVLPLRDSLTVVLIFVAETPGDSGVSIVNIPFGFRAGQRELKPGRYVLNLSDEGVLGLRTVDTSFSSECRIVRVETASPSQKGTLVFVEHDGGYSLTKAFWPKTATERKITPKSSPAFQSV